MLCHDTATTDFSSSDPTLSLHDALPISTDDCGSGTRAGLSGGTTMVVDFCLPAPGQSLLEAMQAWDNKSSKACADYSFHMAVTWWGRQVFDEMATVVDRGINTFKHFMAYKGALMIDDRSEERRVGKECGSTC